MYLIPDDPIISCIERTGFPPWMQDDDPVGVPYRDLDDEEDDDDEWDS